MSELANDILLRIDDEKHYNKNPSVPNTTQFVKDVKAMRAILPTLDTSTKKQSREDKLVLNRILRALGPEYGFAGNMRNATLKAKFENLKSVLDPLMNALETPNNSINDNYVERNNRTATMADLPKDSENEDDKAQGKTRTGSGIRSRRKIYKFRK
jgi:hypothetical protein